MKSVFATTPFIKVNNCHDIHDTELNSSHRHRANARLQPVYNPGDYWSLIGRFVSHRV